MAQSHKKAFRRLYEVAEAQQGFFTAKQAKSAGFAENTHPYHVRAGNWIREHRGIYRLRLFPPTEHSDLNPAKLHMTVPTGFRRNSEIPGILVLHYADLPASDVDTAQGFRFTRPLRTILD